MLIKEIRTRILKEGENLIVFIIDNLKTLNDGSILVVTSKIVSLSERRVREIKNKNTREKLSEPPPAELAASFETRDRVSVALGRLGFDVPHTRKFPFHSDPPWTRNTLETICLLCPRTCSAEKEIFA